MNTTTLGHPRRYTSLTPSMILEVTKSYGAPVHSPEEIAAILAPFSSLDREVFLVVSLDAKNQVLAIEVCHLGTLTMSVVGPREVFRAAILANASSVVVAHNHPSGDATPSPEDIAATSRLAEVGRMLDIPLHDHLILGAGTFTSLRARGLM